MPRGRPRIPTELHVLRGTYRADRHGPKPAWVPVQVPCDFCERAVLATPDQLEQINRGELTPACEPCYRAQASDGEQRRSADR